MNPDSTVIQDRQPRNASTLPTTGFVRLTQIIGDPKAHPPQVGVYPVSKSTWWVGVRQGKYPKPATYVGGSVALWRVEDIVNLIEQLSSHVLPSYTASRGAQLTERRSRKRRLRDSRGSTISYVPSLNSIKDSSDT